MAQEIYQEIYPRYCTPLGRLIDKIIHLAGLVFAVVGGVVLLALTFASRDGRALAIAIYALGFVAMLAASMAYSFGSPKRRSLLRRLDHAGIFLMIAGSYTPFTTHALTGAWAWGMTSAVWAIAGAGIALKLLLPDMRESVSVAFFVALGWIVLIAAGPIIKALSMPALVLLLAGGLVYTAGVIFHVKEHWRFARPIWHGHVLVGAVLHWIAVLIGVVLVTATPEVVASSHPAPGSTVSQGAGGR
ncbi:Channel protein (Hemolysin III family) [Beijerinckiaceae bacterium RH AL1]|nr:hemolysin III family protein [Beijerinckiaceae bacterium]VVB48456.1 Channel protein (Hemolysin III family) [Beijerinckiaceae bacterium RH CH11]VVB48538.1 Channel protein (Hemolysin III family) [Beijerinckiaceae bacterium RH AL8]VVC56404.1 Channel protein (Hemolysin III family) [Beijerinckiaceae bacterium RH AL1]